MLVYFANSSYSKIEKDYFRQLAERIGNNGFEVFWPERDVVIPKGKDAQKNLKLWQAEKFKRIKAADIFVLILDGRPLGAEVLFDLGIFVGQKETGKMDKLVAGLNNESHRDEIESQTPAAVLAAIDCLPRSDYDLIDCLKAYLVTRRKLE